MPKKIQKLWPQVKTDTVTELCQPIRSSEAQESCKSYDYIVFVYLILFNWKFWKGMDTSLSIYVVNSASKYSTYDQGHLKMGLKNNL